MSKCKSCGAAIMWVKTTSGKRMPLDLEPCQDGNVVLGSLGATVYSGTALDVMQRSGDTRLYKSHFATCPQAGLWRQREGR